MKNKLLKILSLFALVFAITACSNTDKKENNSNENISNQVY